MSIFGDLIRFLFFMMMLGCVVCQQNAEFVFPHQFSANGILISQNPYGTPAPFTIHVDQLNARGSAFNTSNPLLIDSRWYFCSNDGVYLVEVGSGSYDESFPDYCLPSSSTGSCCLPASYFSPPFLMCVYQPQLMSYDSTLNSRHFVNIPSFAHYFAPIHCDITGAET